MIYTLILRSLIRHIFSRKTVLCRSESIWPSAHIHDQRQMTLRLVNNPAVSICILMLINPETRCVCVCQRECVCVRERECVCVIQQREYHTLGAVTAFTD